FVKPMEFYKHFLFFGPNLLVSEGALWKKYRKIISPSFNERNNRLVWDEVIRLAQELMDDVWENQPVMTVQDSKDVTFPVSTCKSIKYHAETSPAGPHGHNVCSWKDSLTPKHHKMSFQTALRTLVAGLLHKAVFPDWMMNFTKQLRDIKLAFNEVQVYMGEMIHERRHQNLGDRHDLLSNLLHTESFGESDESLTDQEVLGNMFFLLVAGQDTTAHSLTCVFALLAIYPEEQDKLYRHIKTVITDGRLPVSLIFQEKAHVHQLQSYDDLTALTYVHAHIRVILEAMRLYPVVPGTPRDAVKDTSIPVQGPNGEIVHIPVLEGTSLVCNFPALHYNSSQWDDPYAFQPERFLKKWNRDAYVPFSTGPRACLGRRFAETEMIAFVTMLISRYCVDIKDDNFTAEETGKQRCARLLKQKVLITAGLEKVSLVFRRREE
ncbi:Cytochrome P450 3A25, partial [Leucoagaricus sp. SymC.cos]